LEEATVMNAVTDDLHLAPARRTSARVPPVFVVNAALRLRRLLLRAADAVVPSHLSLSGHFMGAARTMLIHTVARLHIADLLAGGPLTSAELAARTGSDADVMRRILEALASVGVFKRERGGRFSNNRVSNGLLTGAAGSARGFAELFGFEPIMRAWTRLPQTLRDGKQAFKETNDRIAWEWMEKDKDAQAAFIEGMSSMTEVVAPAIAAVHPFDEVKTVCDVGGGVGIVLAAILRRHPHLRGVLFDSESMLGEAKAYLEAAGILDRVELVPGSFFDSVPRGADCYVLKTVLHNWEDAEASKILRNCRAAMEPNQRLILAELDVREDALSPLVPFMDIMGLMIFCGRERSREKLAGMLLETGFRMGRATPLPGLQIVYEVLAV
jgi:hypothetical protein